MRVLPVKCTRLRHRNWKLAAHSQVYPVWPTHCQSIWRLKIIPKNKEPIFPSEILHTNLDSQCCLRIKKKGLGAAGWRHLLLPDMTCTLQVPSAPPLLPSSSQCNLRHSVSCCYHHTGTVFLTIEVKRRNHMFVPVPIRKNDKGRRFRSALLCGNEDYVNGVCWKATTYDGPTTALRKMTRWPMKAFPFVTHDCVSSLDLLGDANLPPLQRM